MRYEYIYIPNKLNLQPLFCQSNEDLYSSQYDIIVRYTQKNELSRGQRNETAGLVIIYLTGKLVVLYQ